VPSLNSEVQRVFKVVDITGSGVSGLTSAAFTLLLRRRNGATLVSTSETVGVTSIGGGEYWIFYTPTVAATLYILTVTAVSPDYIVSAPPEGYQDDIEAVASVTAGPYLTTRDRVKSAFNFKQDEHDARIDQLLPQVTDLFETYCDRQFFSALVTEYPTPLSSWVRVLLAARPPITAVTSLHISSAIPRVYGSSELLVEGTDFFISEDGQWIELVNPRWLYGPKGKAARLVYTGGFTQVPGDLERAAQEVIGVKVLKGAGKLYHFLSEAVGEGSMQVLRWDDITPNALAVMDSYRLRAMV